MKKNLLTLTMMLFPLTAMAQTPVPLGSHASTQSVQAAVDLLAKAVCTNDHKAIVKTVYECYQQTDENSPSIDICILADISVSNDANNKRNQSEALGDSNPYDGIPFVTKNAYYKRLNHFRAAPRFAKLRDDPFNFNNYFKSSPGIITKNLNAKCKSMNY